MEEIKKLLATIRNIRISLRQKHDDLFDIRLELEDDVLDEMEAINLSDSQFYDSVKDADCCLTEAEEYIESAIGVLHEAIEGKK